METLTRNVRCELTSANNGPACNDDAQSADYATIGPDPEDDSEDSAINIDWFVGIALFYVIYLYWNYCAFYKIF